MKVNETDVPEEVLAFLTTAVIHYMEEIEHTEIGARLRRDEVLLNFLNHSGIEKVRTRFYLDTINIKCPKCGVLVDNQDPDLICFSCNQVIEYMPSNPHAYDFCKETCTDTSLDHCIKHQKIKQHLEDKPSQEPVC